VYLHCEHVIIFRTGLDDGEGSYRIDIVIAHLSTGEYHAGVTEPVIYIAESQLNVNYSKMDISGDTLGIWISRYRIVGDITYDIFYLYDWRTGTLKAVSMFHFFKSQFATNSLFSSLL
jgi:hypothetical protein